MLEWQAAHDGVMREFLGFIGSDADLVLKGGTALMLCYGLDRFSEDLDFDAVRRDVSTIDLVRRFCKQQGYELFVKKDTDTVQRCTVHYGGAKPLKIETSYRRSAISSREMDVVNGILTYKLPALALMKVGAYRDRERSRDLFDVTFIVNTYWDSLPDEVKDAYVYSLGAKGLEQFDAILDDIDELVDGDKLAGDFLSAYERVGLLAGSETVYERDRTPSPGSPVATLSDPRPEKPAPSTPAKAPTPASDAKAFGASARARGGATSAPGDRSKGASL
uniref:Nucleotidyl transferase AbiEii/AbiGii toxin family protein n=1 Tax=Muribaculaceae bacterium Z82 TaxID=2304548 RepID=A0A7C9N9X6_9BACT